MKRHPAVALLAFLTATLWRRAQELHRDRDRGSHSVEYAIGIGLSAAIILALFAAYKSGVDNIIKSWVFQ